MNNDLTTLICLFHNKDHANAALQDILKAGIPESNITLIGDEGSAIVASGSSLAELNVPNQDLEHLLDGLKKGGCVLTVSALSEHAEKVEAIFQAYKADKIDEAIVDDDMSASALPIAPSEASPFPTEGSTGAFHLQAEPSTGPISSLDSASTLGAFSSSSEGIDVDPRELGLDPRMKPVEGDL